MQCPTCGAAGLAFGEQCAVCGSICQSTCRYCSFGNLPGARFCGGCGRPTNQPYAIGQHALSFLQSNVPAALVERIVRSGSAMLGERKRVTVKSKCPVEVGRYEERRDRGHCCLIGLDEHTVLPIPTLDLTPVLPGAAPLSSPHPPYAGLTTREASCHCLAPSHPG